MVLFAITVMLLKDQRGIFCIPTIGADWRRFGDSRALVEAASASMLSATGNLAAATMQASMGAAAVFSSVADPEDLDEGNSPITYGDSESWWYSFNSTRVILLCFGGWSVYSVVVIKRICIQDRRSC
jgi:hypothetical protein